MSRVLVVEDDQDIADLIRHYLQKAGHVVESVASGALVAPRVVSARPDLVVLDLMLPGMDGMQVTRLLRDNPATHAIPIIMLTARGEEADRVAGLEGGADDYVTKPFSPKELMARVTALLRRVQRVQTDESVSYGPLTIDSARHRVLVDGAEVRLTAKEFLLLHYLVQHRGRVVSRDQLLTDVWGYQYTGGTRTVDVHIRRLREKVPFLASAIATVTQFGYRLEEQP
ncbi:MAG: response regulator transcription factor [Acidobacteria bacterium]|nr:response regulator transcription factor [Acidobacteriota bacterium]